MANPSSFDGVDVPKQAQRGTAAPHSFPSGALRDMLVNEAKPLAAHLSKTQIDKLGERLRQEALVESDLRLLDEHRRSYGTAYETVVQTIREGLRLEPTGRPAKSTGAVIEKLHRESIRLSQVQDIAGCRIVVADIAEEERVVALLRNAFPASFVVDRRANPSYGYRAIHIIVQSSGKSVEIQIRTSLQHLWAEFSEKLSDVLDPRIKYGGGPDYVRTTLAELSKLIATIEDLEKRLTELDRVLGLAEQRVSGLTSREKVEDINNLRERLSRSRDELNQTLTSAKRELVEQVNDLMRQIDLEGNPREGLGDDLLN